MRTIAVCFVLSAMLATGANASASSREVELRLTALNADVIAGIPVVVALRQLNRTRGPVTIYDLSDPYLSLVSWEWWSESGEYRKVRLADYHYSAVPEPALPKSIVLKRAGSMSTFFTVPTPTEFKMGGRWWLIATVRNPVDPSVKRAEVSFQARTVSVSRLSDGVDVNLVQAALLEHARNDVLSRAFSGTADKRVERAMRDGDLAAQLLAFSKALYEQGAVAEAWQRLEAAPNEVKILRNYLLLCELKRIRELHRDIPADCAALIAAMQPTDAFHAKLSHVLRGETP